jgi:ABC-type multidrug transport system fused ATPase/permease subunit
MAKDKTAASAGGAPPAKATTNPPIPRSFLDQETAFRGRYSKEVFETLSHAYRPFFVKSILLLITGFLGRILMLSNANVIGFWVDSFCNPKQMQCKPVPSLFRGLSNSGFLTVLIAMTFGGFLLLALYRIAFSRMSANAISSLYDETTLRTSRQPIQFFDQNPVGRIVTRFSSDYSNVFRLFGGPLAEFCAIIFDLISMIILVCVASPFYIPIIVSIGFINYGIYRLNRDRLRVERRELSASRSPSIAHFSETTQGASIIRVFARQSVFLKRFLQLNDRFLWQRLRTQKAVLGFSLQMSTTTALLLVVTGVAGYQLVKMGLVSVGSVGVAFTFIVLSGTSIQMFFEWLAQFEEAMTGVERLDNYLRRPLEPGLKLPASRQFLTEHPVYARDEEDELMRSRLVDRPCAGIRVENLWLRYGDENPFVLKGLDFTIEPGEKIGIVGRTGSGKTSFVQALFQLYPFAKGRILIDGKEAEIGQGSDGHPRADLSLFRRSIALISQEPTLFRGTLRQNLDFSGRVSEARLRDALARVGLSPWLNDQPNGLDAVIEERGRNLSAGERQLLCMARCLLQDAPIVVMDEATSSVDPQSEEILVRATREFFKDRTQIIIAHRLSTLEHCDRVLWLHQGEIRAFDKPEKVVPIFRSTEL